ncbi:hypothetical protein B0T26DRAFT_680693 [Lasiosphaeria miniovina]|uniref:Uncharacterized protein n=1 Tax=Lasiosphaeria miniovina TaxID=1954250 RepID=A0AA40A0W7_9PEZI|nr:uncharacterized protein B0T26DRAFT_680693 [Lasiosphaeria miniovina]KAK0707130.1 hypothetical protein B0T26DRAFT_680693 [Lasiosphaeria miniovina]
MHRPLPSYLVSLTLSVLVLRESSVFVAAAAQCYSVNGQKSSGVSCNAAATGSGGAGSHSACCDDSRQEACLSSGLCLATQRTDNQTFWAEGCTDPTGLDTACPSFCGMSSQFISMPVQPSYTMLFCGSGQWCCCFDNLGAVCNQTECCSRNFTLGTRGLGTVVRQLDNTGSASLSSGPPGSSGSSGGSGGSGGSGNAGDDCQPGRGNNCSSSNGNDWRGMRLITIVLVGGLLGSLLLGAIAATCWQCTQNRRLRRQVQTLENNNTSGNLAAKRKASYSGSSASHHSSILSSRSRPSMSVQRLTTYLPPPPHDDSALSPSPDTYDHGGGGGLATPTMASNVAYHQHLMMMHQQQQAPQTPGGGAPPGYGFPGVAVMQMPGQGRRPSWPRNARHTDGRDLFDPNYSVGVAISELPTEKDQR